MQVNPHAHTQTIHKMMHSERPAKKGSRNLRWLMRQIDALNAILESFKHPQESEAGMEHAANSRQAEDDEQAFDEANALA